MSKNIKVKNSLLTLEVFDSGVDMDMKPVENGLAGLQLYYTNENGILETSQELKIITLLSYPVNEQQLTMLTGFVQDVLVPIIQKDIESDTHYQNFKKFEYFSETWFNQLPEYLIDEWAVSLEG